MKLTFENLGALQCGEINLSDLTIICGQNNTGKTYVTYVLYCLIRVWMRLIDIDLKKELNELTSHGLIKIDLEEKIVNKWDAISTKAVKKFKNNFHEMIASKSSLFSKTEINFSMPINELWIKDEVNDSLFSENGELIITIKKNKNSTSVEVASLKIKEIKNLSLVSFEDFIKEKLMKIVLAYTLPSIFIASTERTGATTFKNELNLTKNRIINYLERISKDGGKESARPYALFEAIYSQKEYAIPVSDNVSFINQLPNINSEDGELFKRNPKILVAFETIVGGKYVTNKDGQTYFQPSGSILKLGLGEVSSSVRSLLIIWYWLKYRAKSGDLLVIDEPELNLHPENQRRLARFIATLINNNIKVFITTHSDYLIREFNTLIMLNSLKKKDRLILKKYYEYADENILSFERVALYCTGIDKRKLLGNKNFTKVRTLIPADIDPDFGIDVPSFDETINKINKIQEDISDEILHENY